MTKFNFQTGISETSKTELETTHNPEPATFGKWVLVELKSEKKKFHHFVGQVTEVFDSPSANISVKFLKKVGEKFVWSPNDVSMISKEEIISLLPEPSFDNRGRLSFEHNFTEYNLK